MQRSAGTARHDAVAWGYARGADRRGVDILENCEVTGFLRDGDRITGVTTTRGEIRAKKVAVAVAGHTGHVMKLAGIDKLPIESQVLQAFVSESLKPFLHTVLTFGMGHFYVAQSDKGGLIYGGALDGYNSYAQRGNLPIVEEVMSEMLALFPSLARVRVLRSWGGVTDMSMDGSPIITTGPLPGMYLNCGWCYGGFKATPASGWCFAHTIAKDEPHRAQRAVHARPFPSRHPHRRQGPRRDARASIRYNHNDDHLPLLRPARPFRILLSGRRQPHAPRSGLDRPGGLERLCLRPAEPGRRAQRDLAAFGRLPRASGRDAQHADPRDFERRLRARRRPPEIRRVTARRGGRA